MRWVSRITAFLLSATMGMSAEQSGIYGVVQDVSGHVLADADVRIQSEESGARWKARSDGDGRYTVAGLPAGTYKITARMPGFRTVSRTGIVLERTKGLAVDFAMEVVGLREVITVVSGRDLTDPSNGESLLMTRGSPGAALPANGRDYRALFDLMPGVVITPAVTNDAGQFTSNGQRPNANAFRVDGVSANTGVGGSTLPGAFPGASLPAMTAIGTTENLASPETMQSVELRTSTFAPEYGERPGASAIVTSRSGTNDFRGEFFGHYRDNSWNARDWFANSRAVGLPRPAYRNFGGTYGGPIWRNHTHFFFSAETSELEDTGLQLSTVPSMAARESASTTVGQVLNEFPLPVGKDLGNGIAEGLLDLGRAANIHNLSLRLDHSFSSRAVIFARLTRSESESYFRWINAENGRLRWHSATVGLTAGESTIHDVRWNYSRAAYFSGFAGSNWGSTFDLAGMLPADFNALYSLLPAADNSVVVLGLSVPGLGQFVSGSAGPRIRQDQWELRYSASHDRGGHQFRGGLDYLQLEPTRHSGVRSLLGVASSLQGLIDRSPLPITYSQTPGYGGKVHIGSAFLQDTFRLSEAATWLFGVRWELTPPVGNHAPVISASGIWNGTAWQDIHTAGVNVTGPWYTSFSQIAPRMGLGYRLPKQFVFRAGAGLFFDTRLGAAVNPINGGPFNSWQLPTGGTNTGGYSGGAGGLPGGGTLTPDVSEFLFGGPPPLKLPRSYQWRMSMERAIGAGVGSVAYLGSAGRRLLGNQAYVDPETEVLARFATLTQNSSEYHALQLRHSGTIARDVYLSASYTWSHSLDDGSRDSSVFLIHPGYALREAWASSSFDVRHALTTSISYRIPHSWRHTGLPEYLAGWTLSGIFRARTGFPIDVRSVEPALGRTFENYGRPDLISGLPIWISDPVVAGGRRLNPEAFQQPPTERDGTLRRNSITGNGLGQLDVAVRRQFPLFRNVSLEVGLSVFNLLNHPAFADPVPYLTSPWFGQSTSMQNVMLGLGTPNAGSPPLFHTGGSRSAELNFRVSF